jgi:hypothetical protein
MNDTRHQLGLYSSWPGILLEFQDFRSLIGEKPLITH